VTLNYRQRRSSAAQDWLDFNREYEPESASAPEIRGVGTPVLTAIPATPESPSDSQRGLVQGPLCFNCRAEPAGNDYAGPHSAYCTRCQPEDTATPLAGKQCRCAACGEQFSTVRAFDWHQPQGECADPASLTGSKTLVLVAGFWQRPASGWRAA
jgi:hypothetical protein